MRQHSDHIFRQKPLEPVGQNISGNVLPRLHKLMEFVSIKEHDLIDLAIRWEDKTHKTDHPQFDDIQRKYIFINHQCNDISKKTVQTVFEDVFGYPLAVDPVTYHGTCVMKSNTNSRHDGRLIQCPIDSDEVKSDHVYEKLIDNQYDASLTQEFRIPVFKEHIPFVYLKYRPIEARFRIYTKLEIAKNKVSDLFSGEEIDAIMQFCRRIGLDYGANMLCLGFPILRARWSLASHY